MTYDIGYTEGQLLIFDRRLFFPAYTSLALPLSADFTLPAVVLGQVEHELRLHGLAALWHAEHVEGRRVRERRVSQLGAGDVHALGGVCRREGGKLI